MPNDSLELPRRSKSKSKSAVGFTAVSQSSIFDLKGLVAEHQSTFQKEGKHAVKGQIRSGAVKDMSRDKFSRPSPGIVKRMAHEARNELRINNGRGVLADTESRESEERRAAIMKIKAEKYAALRRGEYGALTDKELAESSVDFERKWQDGNDAWSDHASDEDESANIPHDLRIKDDDFDEYEQIEYIDELGRTRRGTRREAREAETARRNGEGSSQAHSYRQDPDQGQGPSQGRDPRGIQGGSGGETEQDGGEFGGVGKAHQEVLQSNVIYGAQSFFPVYEPTQEDLLERIKAARGPAEVNHYDASRDVRDRAAGAYQFSQDETIRAAQMEALKKQREETEAVRAGRAKSQQSESMLTPAQESKKRKLDERRALIEAKRQKVMEKGSAQKQANAAGKQEAATGPEQ